MTMIVQDSYTSGQFPSLLAPLRRLYDAFVAARQRQANRRTALYMRQMPEMFFSGSEFRWPSWRGLAVRRVELGGSEQSPNRPVAAHEKAQRVVA